MIRRHRSRVEVYRISVLAYVLLFFCVLLSSCSREFCGTVFDEPTRFVEDDVVNQILKTLPVIFEGFEQKDMAVGTPWVLRPAPHEVGPPSINTLRVFYHPVSLGVDISPLENNEWMDGFRENAMYLFEQIEELEEVSFAFFFTPLDIVIRFDEFDFQFTTSRLGVAEGEMLIQRNDQYGEYNIVDVGIELTDITSTGLAVTLINNTDRQFIYGVGYSLQKYVNGQWEDVDVIVEGDWGFILIGYELKPHAISGPKCVDWEWLYGSLDKGIYRYSIEITDWRAPGDFDVLQLYAVFEVE